MRNIVPGIWKDEFFMDLDFTERLLWLGLLTLVADFQGRFQNSPRTIKAEIFASDEIPLSKIKKALQKFERAKKILIYNANDKSLIQIINWWKYQSSASWMNKSDYPAPEEWHDRYRVHVQGGKIETSPNWASKKAGFLPSGYVGPTYQLPSRDGEGEGKGEGNGEGNSKREGEREEEEKKVPASASLKAEEIYKQVTGYPDIPRGHEKAIRTIEEIAKKFKGPEETIAYLLEVFNWWVKQPHKNGRGYYSPLNPAWIDRALVGLTGEKPWETDSRNGEDSNSVKEKADRFFNRNGK